MSESDKSGKPELDAHECEHFLMTDVSVYACECDNIQIVDVKDGYTTEYVPNGQPDERSAAQARIAELEAALSAMIEQVENEHVSEYMDQVVIEVKEILNKRS